MAFTRRYPRSNPVRCSAWLSLLLFAAGCQQTGHVNRVIDILPDPPIGAHPMPVPTDKPWIPEEPRLAAPPGSEHGWVPAGGVSRRWTCIVVHHSANDKSTPQGMASWHVQRGWDELGYHFVIGNGVGYPDGQVFVGSRWPKQKTGAHCKVPGNYYNEHGVGICLIGNFNDRPPTPKQMAALEKLCAFLMQQCNIPPDRIYTHGGVTRKTECPGKKFSLTALRSAVSRRLSIAASTH